jgi:hypothetical protein
MAIPVRTHVITGIPNSVSGGFAGKPGHSRTQDSSLSQERGDPAPSLEVGPRGLSVRLGSNDCDTPSTMIMAHGPPKRTEYVAKVCWLPACFRWKLIIPGPRFQMSRPSPAHRSGGATSGPALRSDTHAAGAGPPACQRCALPALCRAAWPIRAQLPQRGGLRGPARGLGPRLRPVGRPESTSARLQSTAGRRLEHGQPARIVALPTRRSLGDTVAGRNCSHGPRSTKVSRTSGCTSRERPWLAALVDLSSGRCATPWFTPRSGVGELVVSVRSTRCSRTYGWIEPLLDALRMTDCPMARRSGCTTRDDCLGGGS